MGTHYTDFLEREVNKLKATVQQLSEDNIRLNKELAEAKAIEAATKHWLAGEPSDPPVTGQKKRTLF